MPASSVRACHLCRQAKTKCDLTRPTCGRCERLKIRCTGYTAEVDFIFRSENATAARNSKRSRRAMRQASSTSLIGASQRQRSSVSVSSTSGDTSRSHSSDEDDDAWPDFDVPDAQPMPVAVASPVVDRVVNEYFQDWVIKPSSQGKQTGNMVHMVALYLSAHEKSTYRTVIQACAYAHLYHEEDGAFAVKAKAIYGKALLCMRDEIADPFKVHDDRLLAALLLLDNFELLRLNKRNALGAHSDGVKHLLAARGKKQFKGGQSFAMWRIAHHRLLARQIHNRQAPDPRQTRWMRTIEIDRPDLRLSVDSMEMCELIGNATALLNAESDMEKEEQLTAAQMLVLKMRCLLEQMHSWLNSLPPAWRPRHLNGHLESEPVAFHTSASHGPMSKNVIVHHDMWLAYMLEFREATEIVLRESLIGLLEMIEALSNDADPVFFQDNITQEIAEIGHLSAGIIQYIPKFKKLAFEAKGPLQRSFERPELSGRFHSFFAITIMQRAKYVPWEDKVVANWVSDSVKVDYALP